MRVPYWNYDRLQAYLAGFESATANFAASTERAAGQLSSAGLPRADIALAVVICDYSHQAETLARTARAGFTRRNHPYDPVAEQAAAEQAQAAAQTE